MGMSNVYAEANKRYGAGIADWLYLEMVKFEQNYRHSDIERYYFAEITNSDEMRMFAMDSCLNPIYTRSAVVTHEASRRQFLLGLIALPARDDIAFNLTMMMDNWSDM